MDTKVDHAFGFAATTDTEVDHASGSAACMDTKVDQAFGFTASWDKEVDHASGSAACMDTEVDHAFGLAASWDKAFDHASGSTERPSNAAARRDKAIDQSSIPAERAGVPTRPVANPPDCSLTPGESVAMAAPRGATGVSVVAYAPLRTSQGRVALVICSGSSHAGVPSAVARTFCADVAGPSSPNSWSAFPT